MKELFNRIIKWGSDKGVHDIQFEPLVQIGFLLEELHEVNKEFIAGNTDKAVGEICDLIVYSVNTMLLIEYGGECLLEYNVLPKHRYDTKEAIINWLLHSINNISVYALIRNYDNTEKKTLANNYFTLIYDNSEKKALANNYFDLIEVCCECIKSLGYSPEIALEETIKKIESRRGAMNPITGKWEKFIGQHDIYIPDYLKARINND